MNGLAKMLNLKQQKAKRQALYEEINNLDEIIIRLKKLPVKNQSESVALSEKEFIGICRMARNVTLSQPSLLRLNGPIIVATGTLGYYKDLCKIFSKCGHVVELFNYLFLGDYTGRGQSSIQCLMLLFCYKIKFEFNFFLLRGCFESLSHARSYNLYEQCSKRYSPKAWAEACEALCSLPFAAIINNQVFCVHGGISPELKSLDDINKIPRPIDTPQIGMPCDLIWSDPSYKEDSLLWTKNERGFGYSFHHSIAQKFVKQKRFSLICRAHEIAYDGFQYNSNKTCVTLTSLANYCELFNNSAAVMNIDSTGLLYFKVFQQRQFFPLQTNIKMTPDQYLARVRIQKMQEKKRLEEINMREREEEQLLEERQKWRQDQLKELESQETKKLEKNQTNGEDQIKQKNQVAQNFMFEDTIEQKIQSEGSIPEHAQFSEQIIQLHEQQPNQMNDQSDDSDAL